MLLKTYACIPCMGTIVFAFCLQTVSVSASLCQECSYVQLDSRTKVANCSSRNLYSVPLHIDTKTTILNVSCNHIQNVSHDAFARLLLLNTVYLNHNNISLLCGSPFAGLDNLTYIDLSFNQIKCIFSESFDRIKNLHVLLINENEITAIQNYSFRGLTSLHLLDISNNKLEQSVFNESIFEHQVHLKELRMQRNLITTYPDQALAKCTSLETLVIDGLNNRKFEIGFRNLTKLKNMLLSGFITNCDMQTLYHDTFVHVPSIRNLNISYCGISTIEPGTFSPLADLFLLNVSHNYPHGLKLIRNITFGLQNTSIKVVTLDYMEIMQGNTFRVQPSDVIFMKNLPIQILSLRGNKIQSFEFGALSFLPKTLEIVFIDDNAFTFDLFVFEIKHLQNLRIVYADYMNTYHGFRIPRGDPCASTIYKYIGQIKNASVTNLYYTQSTQYDYTAMVNDSTKTEIATRNDLRVSTDSGEDFALARLASLLPSQIEEIYIRSSNIDFEIPELTFVKNNNIRVLNLSKNIFYRWKGPLKHLDRLKGLDLSGNYCYNVTVHFFMYLVTIEWLEIPENFLGYNLKKDKNGEIFQNLVNLKTLNLRNNRITFLPRKCFKNLVSLERLLLGGNSISDFKIDIAQMKNISFIDLSNNQLDILPEDVRGHLMEVAKQRNVTINLFGNPLECKCKNIDFFKWLENSEIHFQDISGYYCRNKDWHVVKLMNISEVINKLEKDCAKLTAVITVLSVLISLFVIIIVICLLYKKRWKLRYLYYMTIGRYKLMHVDHAHKYKYDAFISYADETQDFVTSKMISNLEVVHQLSLCIHQRDFTPGHAIRANIVDAIQNSRRTVVVMTRAFLDSYWCLYEFNMARMESTCTRGGKTVLFLVMLENIFTHDVPLEIMDVIQNQSYIEYPNDEQGDIVFWDKLQQAIKQQ